MRDDVIEFTGNPSAFIINNPIVLSELILDLPPGTPMPSINNLRAYFTLTTKTQQGGFPEDGALPCLRIQPAGSGPVVNPPGGGVLNTIDAFYCHSGNGGTALHELPYCDISIQPAPNEPRCLFTPGMNGCSLVVLSVVPPLSPPLALNCFRVVHDYAHRGLTEWAATGAVVRFAAYENVAQAGAVPAGWGLTPVSYNPHNYAYSWVFPGCHEPGVRVITNFLYWIGGNWTFNSRHYIDYNKKAFNFDAPPSGFPSTASMNI